MAEKSIVTEVRIIVSDGDNSYRIRPEQEEAFDEDCRALLELEQESDEWHDACIEFDSTWGDYKI